MAALPILALADDLTGALEAGAKLAGNGIPAVVTTDLEIDAAPTTAALVIDTETRHCSPADAGAIVRKLAARARERGAFLLYKKTDSTLRGNIGAELAALLAANPGSPLFYGPAYPKMGRTVRNGRLLLDGVPVDQTEFARDALSPVRESHIPALLAAQCDVPVRAGGTAAAGVIHIFDAVSDEDVEQTAHGLLRGPLPWLAAGPAALLEAVARIMPYSPTQPPQFPRVRSVLLINGSLHQRSLAQVEHARATGWRTVAAGARLPDPEARCMILDQCENAGAVVRALVDRGEVDSLLVFGGITTFRIVQALGQPLIHPFGEILPGVPFSRVVCGGREVNLITKAGGFGAADLANAILNRLAAGASG